MVGMPFGFRARKLAEARAVLAGPHPDGEVRAIAAAMLGCRVGLTGLRPGDLGDASADGWVAAVRHALDGAAAPGSGGGWACERRAAELTEAEAREFAGAVGHLADWLAARVGPG